MNIMIILNYNDADMVLSYMKKVGEYQIVNKFIIVDNCSTDTSWEKLKVLKSEKIDIVKTEKNSGYSAGNNYGIKYSEKLYGKDNNIIISNPDIIVSEENLKEILQALMTGYDMSTGLIYNYNPQTKEKRLASNFGWKVPTYVDMISNCFFSIYKIRRSILKNSCYLNYERNKNKKYIDTEAVPGCFFAIKGCVLNEIEYFDENTFLFGEETILAWKLKHNGKKVCIVDGIEVLHMNSVSINKNIKQSNIKEKYRLESELVYITDYLQCSWIQRFIYKIAYYIGIKEKGLITRLMDVKKYE